MLTLDDLSDETIAQAAPAPRPQASAAPAVPPSGPPAPLTLDSLSDESIAELTKPTTWNDLLPSLPPGAVPAHQVGQTIAPGLLLEQAAATPSHSAATPEQLSPNRPGFLGAIQNLGASIPGGILGLAQPAISEMHALATSPEERVQEAARRAATGDSGSILQRSLDAIENAQAPGAPLGPSQQAQVPESAQRILDSGVRSLIPSVGFGVMGSALGGAAAGPAGPIKRKLFQAAGAALGGASSMGIQTYDNKLQEYIRKGMDKDRARVLAGLMGVSEGGTEGLSDAVTFGWFDGILSKAAIGELRALKALAPAAREEAMKKVAKNFSSWFTKNLTAEGLSIFGAETGSEVANALAQNTLEDWFQVPRREKQSIPETFGTAAIITLAMAPFGLHARSKAAREVRSVLSSAEADPAQRMAIVDTMHDELVAQKLPVQAAVLRADFANRIAAGQAIDLNQTGEVPGPAISSPAGLLERTDEYQANTDQWRAAAPAAPQGQEGPKGDTAGQFIDFLKQGLEPIRGVDTGTLKLVPIAELSEPQKRQQAQAARRGVRVVYFDAESKGELPAINAGPGLVFIPKTLRDQVDIALKPKHEIGHALDARPELNSLTAATRQEIPRAMTDAQLATAQHQYGWDRSQAGLAPAAPAAVFDEIAQDQRAPIYAAIDANPKGAEAAMQQFVERTAAKEPGTFGRLVDSLKTWAAVSGIPGITLPDARRSTAAQWTAVTQAALAELRAAEDIPKVQARQQLLRVLSQVPEFSNPQSPGAQQKVKNVTVPSPAFGARKAAEARNFTKGKGQAAGQRAPAPGSTTNFQVGEVVRHTGDGEEYRVVEVVGNDQYRVQRGKGFPVLTDGRNLARTTAKQGGAPQPPVSSRRAPVFGLRQELEDRALGLGVTNPGAFSDKQLQDLIVERAKNRPQYRPLMINGKPLRQKAAPAPESARQGGVPGQGQGGTGQGTPATSTASGAGEQGDHRGWQGGETGVAPDGHEKDPSGRRLFRRIKEGQGPDETLSPQELKAARKTKRKQAQSERRQQNRDHEAERRQAEPVLPGHFYATGDQALENGSAVRVVEVDKKAGSATVEDHTGKQAKMKLPRLQAMRRYTQDELDAALQAAEERQAADESGLRSLQGEIKRHGGLFTGGNEAAQARAEHLLNLRPAPGTFTRKATALQPDRMAQALGYETSQAMFEALQRELETGRPVYYEGDKFEAQFSLPSPGSRAEFNVRENGPKVEGIKEAIRSGKRIVLATHLRATWIKSPDHIRLSSAGEVQIPEGRRWVSLTAGQVDSLAARAGLEVKPWNERAVYSGNPSPRRLFRSQATIPTGKIEPKTQQKPVDEGLFDKRKPEAQGTLFSLPRRRISLRYAQGSQMAKNAIESLVDEPIVNRDSGIVATISNSTVGEMLSGKIIGGSASPQAHMQAVANIDHLFRLAVYAGRRPDNQGSLAIRWMRHFEAPMPFDGDVVNVKILAKEFTQKDQGTRIYSMKAVEIEKKPASSMVESDLAQRPRQSPIRPAGFTEKYNALLERVKAGEVFAGGWDEGPTESQPGPEAKFSLPSLRDQAFRDSKVRAEDGTLKVVYHGGKRPDRIGSIFRADRATSGPMQYFTDSPEIASNYATGKQGTSFEAPDDYSGWFKFKPPGSRSPVDLDRVWYYLTGEQRRDLAEKLPHVSNMDADGEPLDNFHLDPSEYGAAGKETWEWQIQETRGNVLKAAKEIWLNGGVLFGQEERFLDLLHTAGLDGIQFDSPYRENPAVFPVYLNITRPFVTSEDVTPEVLSDLKKLAAGKRGTRRLFGADAWDKNTRDPREWVRVLEEDTAAGVNTYAWTSIPDWVTDYLKSKGFDGIHDTGGKGGGEEHSVWVPFYSHQIKSATGNVGTYGQRPPTRAEAKPLGLTAAQELKAQEKGDIRFSLPSALNTRSWRRRGLNAQAAVEYAVKYLPAGGRPQEDVIGQIPAGAEYLQRVERAWWESHRRAAAWSRGMTVTAKALGRADRKYVRESFLRDYEANGASQSWPSPAVARFAEAWREANTTVGDEAGRIIETFHGRDPDTYVPHRLTDEGREVMQKQAGEEWDALVAAAKTNGIDIHVLQGLHQDPLRQSKYGSIDYARLSNLPWEVTTPAGDTVQILETDPAVLFAHVRNAARRLSTIEEFGADEASAEYLDELAGDLVGHGTLRTDETVAALSRIWARLQGNDAKATQEWNRITKGWWQVADSIVAGLNLSGAVIGNVVGGHLPESVRMGFVPTMKAFYEAHTTRLSSADYDELHALVDLEGDLLQELASTETLEGKAGRAAGTLLKATGFVAANRRINLAVARAMQKTNMKMMLAAVRAGANGKKSTKWEKWWGKDAGAAQRYLEEELKFSPEDVSRMALDGPTDQDLARAIGKELELVNAMNESPGSRPAFVAHPAFRMAFAYSTFARKMWDTTKLAGREARAGNYRPLATLLVAGVATGELTKWLKDFLKDREAEEEGWLERFLGDLSQCAIYGLAGGFGYAISRLDDPQADFFSDSFKPPHLETIPTLVAGLVKSVRDVSVKPLWKAAARVGPGIDIVDKQLTARRLFGRNERVLTAKDGQEITTTYTERDAAVRLANQVYLQDKTLQDGTERQALDPIPSKGKPNTTRRLLRRLRETHDDTEIVEMIRAAKARNDGEER